MAISVRKSIKISISLLLPLFTACGGGNSGSAPFEEANNICDASLYSQPADVSLIKLNLDQAFPLITALEFHPHNNNVFYILQQTGEITRVEKSAESYTAERLVSLSEYYDVYFSPEGPGSCHECGLYGLAFHPDFESNGYLYLSFTEGGHDEHALRSYVSRFVLENDGRSLVKNAESNPFREDIFSVEQPSWIHNNGKVRFGPDGYLYISFGDGGNAQYSQQPDNVFGSILRLTDEGAPAEGNNVDQGLDEVFAYGFRNPWSWSFDKLTGDLWLGDVGWTEVEEINRVQNGGNYGWPCFEGLRENARCEQVQDFISPLVDYHHIEGRSVTGGYVYRGQALEGLYGQYIFGDFVSGVIWRLQEQEDGSFERKQLTVSNFQISSFAEDNHAELYVLDYFSGEVYQITAPEENSARINIPENLSATGCVNIQDPASANDGILAYEINEAFWSDNADKQRFISLPENTRIKIHADGDFELPPGSILIKNFQLDERLIETRLLLKQEDAGWSGYSYRWNSEQTEATLLETHLDEVIENQTWHYPGRGECKACHTPAAGFSLGLEVAQLNREIIDAQGKTINQLDYWQDLGLFETSIAAWQEVTLANSKDTSLPLAERARSYLHSNCSQCHRPGGTTQAAMDFRFETHLPQTNACKTEALHGDLGFAHPLILDPGYLDNSLLFHRINRRGENQMPPLASNIIDEHGVRLLSDWITSLEYCDSIVGPIEFDYKLKNISSNTYLSTSGNQLSLSEENSGNEAAWRLEPAVEKYYRIANVENPNAYLHTEQPGIQLGTAPVYWLSAMWELVPDRDAWLIRNRWRHDQYVGVENDGLSQTTLRENREGQRWHFETIQ